jgi:hypothetical protein
VRLEGLGKLKKSTSSGTRTGDLQACSIVPQPTTLLRAPRNAYEGNIKVVFKKYSESESGSNYHGIV